MFDVPCIWSHFNLTFDLSFQYVADFMYQGKPTNVYMYSYSVGTKNNNYTLLVANDTQYPILLHFIGYDNLFGSHYDEYVVEYNTFSPSAPDPDVFKFQDSKCGRMGTHAQEWGLYM